MAIHPDRDARRCASDTTGASLDTDSSSIETDQDAVFRLASACQVIAGSLPEPDTGALRNQLLAFRSVLPRHVIVAQVLAEHLLMGLALKLRQCLPVWRPELDGRFLAILRTPAPDAARQLVEFLVDLLDDHSASSTPRLPAPPHVDAKLRVVLGEVGRRCADRRFTLKAAADEVSVTTWHLDRLLTRHTGHSFVHHLRAARLAAAQELLVGTFKTIKEVAAATGYNSVTHLDRDFRRHLGCSPRAWRDAMRKNG